jgi:xanthine dehydrogenase YagR molybdenum-binding subunit
MESVLGQAYPPKQFRNGERPPDSMRGNPDENFSSGAAKVDATYVTPMEHHNPMEPHATIARWDGDRLTIWTATQGISGAQSTLAALFDIDPANVRVICPYVGGGFGCKGSTWPPATLAAMAAKIVNRPVKLVVTRAQMFTSNGYRPRTRSCALPPTTRAGWFRCGTTASRRCRCPCLASSVSRSGSRPKCCTPVPTWL